MAMERKWHQCKVHTNTFIKLTQRVMDLNKRALNHKQGYKDTPQW